MKKILLMLFLFLAYCVPSFATQSISVPDANVEAAKKAITVHMMNSGWSLKNDTNYFLDFEKQEREHDPEKYRKEELINKQLYKVKQDEIEQMEDGFWKNISNLTNIESIPEYYNSWKTINRQFVFSENNGVIINTDLSFQELQNLQKIVFNGYYTYNITYKIPMLKKQIEISDTPQTNYTSMNRIGGKTKIVKINDKNVKDYTKQEIQNLFNNCFVEKLKLESEGGKVYYILRTFVEPTYKQYL